MSKPQHSPLVSWLFAGKDGQLVIVQFPNVSFLVAAVAWVGLHISKLARWNTPLEGIFTAALMVWSVQEIGWGDSRFRRILGAVVLGWIVFGLAMQLLHKY